MTEGEADAVEFDPFAGPALLLTAPSTEPQREIWTACRMGTEASLAFNESGVLRLRGALDGAALTRGVRGLVARHEALRTTFSTDGLTLCVAAEGDAEVPVVDLAHLPEEAREALFAELLAAEVEDPFDLEKGPLFRFKLARLADEEHRLVFTAHHIVCDGWSTAVLMKDLGLLYTAGGGGGLPEAEAFSAYARAEAQRGNTPEYAAAEAHWLKQLSPPPPPLDLPGDRPRPPLKTYGSRREDYTLEPALVAGLRRTGARAGASFFATLLAGFKALLHRLSEQEDVVVGIPAAGQSVGGHQNLVGHCVNTLALRSRVDRDQTFTRLLRAVRTTMLDAYEHQQVTLGAVLKKLPLARDPSRLPLVSTLFNVDQALTAEALPFGGLRAEFASNPRHFENFDVFVNAVEEAGRVVLEVQYNTDLFDAPTIRHWLACYETLLRSAVADPSTEIGRLDVVSEADRAQLEAWNDTAADYPRGARIHDLVQAQAARTPERVALGSAGRSLTYGELNRRANQAARALRDLGVERGTLVGLCLDRSPDMLVGLLAILKAGGAYVPLDPAYPKDRLAFMVEDSRMPVVVTESALAADLPLGGARTLLLDTAAGEIAGRDGSDIGPEAGEGPEDVAYVIYTSGSTGTPKGVQVPHRAVVNFLASVREEPGMGQSDVLAAVTTLSFDIAVLELLLPLTVGARIALASREVAGDGPQLAALLAESGATVMQATPSTWRLLLAAGWSGGAAFTAICGGEALPRDLAQQLVENAGTVWNMYGPTETTVWSTRERLANPVRTVTIGRPLANTQVYVLDDRLQLVPVGARGELHIGGDGVTHGYLGRPELTAERFVADPFRPGARLYKTGDVARFRADGAVEYLGRNDTQVKVRGFRIELGEIEAVLARHAGVGQAVVAAREVKPGDVRLVAYVIPAAGGAPADEELREFLRGSLPEYMVPQHFVTLAAFPLTPNGKIDRKALPLPTGAGAAAMEYVEPRTESERLVAGLWQTALGVARLSVHDNFFHLGGHSLLASQVLSRLRRDHGMAVPFRKLFEAPTVERFAVLLEAEAASPVEGPRIPRRADRDRAPVTLMQQRLLFLEEMDPRQKVVHSLASAFRLRGALDPAALQQALDRIVQRHEALRTVFSWEDGAPVQVIRPPAPVPVPLIDWSGLPEEEREAALFPFLRESAQHPLDVVEGPLFVASLLRLGADDHVLSFQTHNAVWDGWSFDIFRRELAALYAEATGGPPARLPDLPVSYGDFAAWHREWTSGPEVTRQTAWWREQLQGELPVLELPTDRPRLAANSPHGGTETIRLSRAEVDRLGALGRESEATLFMVLLAAFNVLLARYSGQRELLVGTPVRARTQPEIENLIGPFVNALVLRTAVDPGETFLRYLERVRGMTLDAFSNQEMPFELLGRQAPILRAFFSLQDTRARELRLGDLELTQLPGISPGGATDITLWLMEQTDGLFAALNYRTDLFDTATMARFLGHFRNLLAAVLQDPARPVGRLALMDGAERADLVGGSDAAPPIPACVHVRVAEQAARTPDAVAVAGAGAVEGRGRTLTFGDLERRAEVLAHRLRALGVGPGSAVGVCLDRSPDLVVALLGVLKAGGACLPLDPADPSDRWDAVLADAGARALVTERALEPHLPSRPVPVLQLDDAAGEASPRAGAQAAPEDPAWLLPVSDPRGRPRIVELSHGALTRLAGVGREAFGVGPGDVALAVSPLSHESAIPEILVPLLSGARLVFADEEAAGGGARLAADLARSGATVLIAPPSTLAALLASGWAGQPALKAVCSGAPLAAGRTEQILPLVESLWNAWGSAETGIWTTARRVTSPAESSLLGRALPGSRVYVVDAAGELVPEGVPGEAAVAGPGVALGYRGVPDATRFGPDPFGRQGRLFRTGERVRRRAGGEIEWMGRQDDRLLLQGLRVEPEEIEAVLTGHAAVAEAVVTLAVDDAGRDRLVAYVVGVEGQEPAPGDLRRLLRRRVPDALVPSSFVSLASLPRKADGTTDRAALPGLSALRARESRPRVEPRTAMEQTLAEAWGELLGVAPEVHDNFFDLGGHSLLATMVVHRVLQRTGRRLGLRELMFQTLEQIARTLETAPVAAKGRTGILEAVKGALRREW
jgi:amino acid adenylation domain-containing protein